MLKLNGCIVTVDAMGTQKEIASVIRERGANCLLPIKENHPGLSEDISLCFSTDKAACGYAKTVEKSHGRYEKRECRITEDMAWLHGREKWRDLSGIAMILSAVQKSGNGSQEQTVHYLLFSKSGMTACDVLRVKRRHWSIENSLHWVLDVDLGEDPMRMRVGNAAENMNILRHLALDLLKAESSFKGSINLKRKKRALSPSYLLKVFASQAIAVAKSTRRQHLHFRKYRPPQHIIIHGGAGHLPTEADSLAHVCFVQKRQRMFAENIQIQRRIILPRSGAVLPKRHVQLSVKLVFNASMVPHRIRKLMYVGMR